MISAITLHSPTDLCDKGLSDGWYRFVGAAGTKMPTKKENNYNCGATYSSWLKDAHPKVGDGEVSRTVCFDRSSDTCEKTKLISVKNCGSYHIYKLSKTSLCPYRYCGTNCINWLLVLILWGFRVVIIIINSFGRFLYWWFPSIELSIIHQIIYL